MLETYDAFSVGGKDNFMFIFGSVSWSKRMFTK